MTDQRAQTRYMMTMSATFEAPLVIAGGPCGMRRILHVTSGRFEGDSLRGIIMPHGADWVLTRPDGVHQLDIRFTLRTDDDELIYMTSSGLFVIDPEKQAAIRNGQSVPRTDYYFRTAIFFETGARAYSWMNRVLAIGIGTRTQTGMETEVLQLA